MWVVNYAAPGVAIAGLGVTYYALMKKNMNLERQNQEYTDYVLDILSREKEGPAGWNPDGTKGSRSHERLACGAQTRRIHRRKTLRSRSLTCPHTRRPEGVPLCPSTPQCCPTTPKQQRKKTAIPQTPLSVSYTYLKTKLESIGLHQGITEGLNSPISNDAVEPVEPGCLSPVHVRSMPRFDSSTTSLTKTNSAAALPANTVVAQESPIAPQSYPNILPYVGPRMGVLASECETSRSSSNFSSRGSESPSNESLEEMEMPLLPPPPLPPPPQRNVSHGEEPPIPPRIPPSQHLTPDPNCITTFNTQNDAGDAVHATNASIKEDDFDNLKLVLQSTDQMTEPRQTFTSTSLLTEVVLAEEMDDSGHSESESGSAITVIRSKSLTVTGAESDSSVKSVGSNREESSENEIRQSASEVQMSILRPREAVLWPNQCVEGLNVKGVIPAVSYWSELDRMQEEESVPSESLDGASGGNDESTQFLLRPASSNSQVSTCMTSPVSTGRRPRCRSCCDYVRIHELAVEEILNETRKSWELSRPKRSQSLPGMLQRDGRYGQDPPWSGHGAGALSGIASPQFLSFVIPLTVLSRKFEVTLTPDLAITIVYSLLIFLIAYQISPPDDNTPSSSIVRWHW